VFQKILLAVAENGNWFNADKLAMMIKLTGEPFFFTHANIESTLKLKADTIVLGDLHFEKDPYDEFNPVDYLRYELLVKPLFKAYCYLFAGLGILAIRTGEAPQPLAFRGKSCPVSPYDSLKEIKVTSFGQWCLGLTKEAPKAAPQQYEAIADKELFLVTVRGNSLERKVYLDRIGSKLGESRWRISAASFLSSCATRKDIENRIERFKSLIDPNPAPHWTEFFEKLKTRAGLFDHPKAGFLIFDLPADRALAEELLSDKALSSMVLRAEGRLLIVPAKNKKKFTALLAEHGIAFMGDGGKSPRLP
jgi:hypothetical protein